MVRTYKWPPDIIDNLFVDRLDYHGLLFWYDDIKKQIDDLKKPKA